MAYGDCGSARAFALNFACLKVHPCRLLMARVLSLKITCKADDSCLSPCSLIYRWSLARPPDRRLRVDVALTASI
jgi:hypothetical protein